MRIIHVIDKDGFYIGDQTFDDSPIFVEDNEGNRVEKIPDLPENTIDIPLPDGMFKAKWYKGRWIETADQTYMNEVINKPNDLPKSSIEKLQEENDQLKIALAEMAEANEKDKTNMQIALAELAEIVAGGNANG